MAAVPNVSGKAPPVTGGLARRIGVPTVQTDDVDTGNDEGAGERSSRSTRAQHEHRSRCRRRRRWRSLAATALILAHAREQAPSASSLRA